MELPPFKAKKLAACAMLACAASVNAQELITLSDEQLLVLQRGIANSQLHFKPLDDNVLNYYLSNLASQLNADKRIHVVFSNSNSINAVAMWGDVIMFHAGLALFTHSENELAGVLAHELAHISQEHFSRLPEQAGLFNKLVVGGLLTALIAKPEIAGDVFISSQAISQSLTYDVLRQYEREADQRAARTLIANGFDSLEYIKLLERMGSASKAGLPEYLSTHPISSNRVAELSSYIRNVSQRAQAEVIDRNDLNYWLIRSRQNYLINSNNADELKPPRLVPLLKAYENLLERRPGSENTPELAANASNWIIAYELGIANIALGNHKKADEILQAVYELDPQNPIFIAALLQVHALSKNRIEAVKLLASLPEKLRLDPAVTKAEIQLWFELDEQVNYDVAVAYNQYVNGNLSGAKNLASALRGKIHKDDESSSVLARLALLENKIRLLTGSEN